MSSRSIRKFERTFPNAVQPGDYSRSQNIQQCNVSGWRDFKEQMPNVGDKVVIANFSTNKSTIMIWDDCFDYLLKDGDMWVLSPA